MFLEGNKALILLMGLVLGIILIGGIFIFNTRPRADIQLTSEGKAIKMAHNGGDDLVWKELRISVTEGRDSATSFINPTTSNNKLGKDNQALSDQDPNDEFTRAEEVKIYRTSDNGVELEPRKYYHLVLKYKSTTNTIITDKNILMRPEYE